MGRRSDHTRSELAVLVLQAARDIVVEEGAAGITMRKLAAKIGYAAGSIYNAVGDQDEVLRQVHAATLAGLVSRLDLDLAGLAASEDMARPRAIAESYVNYVMENALLWAALLERPPSPGEAVPESYALPRARLIAIVAEAIAPFFPDPEQRRMAVVALWAALQGIASLAIGGNLSFLGDAIDPRAVAGFLVERMLVGNRPGFPVQ